MSASAAARDGAELARRAGLPKLERDLNAAADELARRPADVLAELAELRAQVAARGDATTAALQAELVEMRGIHAAAAEQVGDLLGKLRDSEAARAAAEQVAAAARAELAVLGDKLRDANARVAARKAVAERANPKRPRQGKP